MSFNDLVCAAVQRTNEIAASPLPMDFISTTTATSTTTRKTKRAKPSIVSSPEPAGGNSNNGGEDEEEKQKKRRAQIAEASRRSRARRKKEFQDFKEENDQLWAQNIQLRKMLQDANIDVPAPPLISKRSSTRDAHSGSEDDDNVGEEATPCPSPFHAAPNNHHHHHHHHHSNGHHHQHDSATAVAMALASAAAAASAAASPQHPPSPPPPVVTMQQQQSVTAAVTGSLPDFDHFFELRLTWYFTQLKQDCLRSFASQLSYEQKLKLAGMQVRLVNVAEAASATVPTAAAATALRMASANQAEQAVNEDKMLRL